MANTYDKIILGAGLYGLYSALFCGSKKERVLVLEYDGEAFSRATYINQARVHMGYHYPRSISTALKSKRYYDRFHEDFGFCVRGDFNQVYATSRLFSWTDAKQFEKFCTYTNIRCDEVPVSCYFKEGMCDGAFLTTEDTFDAQILKQYFLDKIAKLPNVQIKNYARIKSMQPNGDKYVLSLADGTMVEAPFVLNATFASVNQIHALLGFEAFRIKYELCELILCSVSENMKGIGITVMDGPFFSIMPFGKNGLHSLTSVTFTPHVTSFASTPVFPCQANSKGTCTPAHLGNCNHCPGKPGSAWPYMSSLTRKYLKDEYRFDYAGSLYSIKPILKASEIDDSRPTVIRQFNKNPAFFSVLSGKINTVYDLEEVLT